MKLKDAGNLAFHAGEYLEAIALYTEAIEACPPERPLYLASLHQSRAACYEQLKKWWKVNEDCTSALKLNDKYIKAYLRRSRAAAKTGDLELALEDITSVCLLEKFQEKRSLLIADKILENLAKQHAREALANRRPFMPSKHFIKTYYSTFTKDPIATLKPDDKTCGFAKDTIVTLKPDDKTSGFAKDTIATLKPDDKTSSFAKDTIATLKPDDKTSSFAKDTIATLKPDDKTCGFAKDTIATLKLDDKTSGFAKDPIATLKPDDKTSGFAKDTIATLKPDDKSSGFAKDAIATLKLDDKTSGFAKDPIATLKPDDKTSGFAKDTIATFKLDDKTSSFAKDTIATLKPYDKTSGFAKDPIATLKPDDKTSGFAKDTIVTLKPDDKTSGFANDPIARLKPDDKTSGFAKDTIATLKPDDKTSGFAKDTIATLKLDDKTSGFAKAKLALDAKDYDSIIDACSEELKDTDGKYENEALLLRATVHLLFGLYDEADADLAKVIESGASKELKVNALIKRATLFTQLEYTELCLEDFREAAQLDPTNPDIFYHRGQFLMLLDCKEEAAADFAKAIELNPDFPMACIQKCYADYLLISDYRHKESCKNVDVFTQVLPDFQRTLERFPDCTEAYMVLARVLSDQREWDRAEALLDAALSVHPSNATLYAHKGIIQRQKSSGFYKAVRLFNKAIEMDVNCDFAYENLGIIEVQRGNLQRSLELFEKAISLAKTEQELIYLFSLKEAAAAQMKVAQRWGLDWTNKKSVVKVRHRAHSP